MDQERKLKELLADFDTAMLVTHSDIHGLAARPMAIAQVEEDGGLWFLTDRASGKILDLAGDNDVAITLQDSKRFLTLSGRAEITYDREKIAELWNKSFQIWFPEGQEDPSISLLHIVPTHGEYWDHSGLSGAKYLLKAGKAYLQQERPELDASTHAEVSLGDRR